MQSKNIVAIILSAHIIALSATSCSDMIQDSRSNVFPLLSSSTQCPVPTSAMNTYLDLTGPSEIGAVSVSMDCEYLYICGSYNVQPYIYKISIATNEITYANIPNRSHSSVIVGNYIWTVEGYGQPKGSCSLQKINIISLDTAWVDETVLDDARSITYDGRYLWCADRGSSQMLHRVDPQTHAITSYSGIVQSGARHMLFDGNWLWLSCSDSSSVVRINPLNLTYTVLNGIINAWGICYDGKSIIVAGSNGNIYQINPSTTTITDSTTITASWLCHCSFNGRHVWITEYSGLKVMIIDPSSLDLLDVRTDITDNPFMSISDGTFQWILRSGNPRILKMTM
jgi:hypothetical protein